MCIYVFPILHAPFPTNAKLKKHFESEGDGRSKNDTAGSAC